DYVNLSENTQDFDDEHYVIFGKSNNGNIAEKTEELKEIVESDKWLKLFCCDESSIIGELKEGLFYQYAEGKNEAEAE
ncbi:18851_t:CDS:1, partial [Racocetra fulgida]